MTSQITYKTVYDILTLADGHPEDLLGAPCKRAISFVNRYHKNKNDLAWTNLSNKNDSTAKLELLRAVREGLINKNHELFKSQDYLSVENMLSQAGVRKAVYFLRHPSKTMRSPPSHTGPKKGPSSAGAAASSLPTLSTATIEKTLGAQATVIGPTDSLPAHAGQCSMSTPKASNSKKTVTSEAMMAIHSMAISPLTTAGPRGSISTAPAAPPTTAAYADAKHDQLMSAILEFKNMAAANSTTLTQLRARRAEEEHRECVR